MEAADLRHRIPDAVVAVMSATAPLVASDWSAIERVAWRTDLVVGVVSKIDAHRGWRAVLDEDRATVAGLVPHRASMPWLGVAAAPDVGAPIVTELVDLLREVLADPALDRRNALRRSTSRGSGSARAVADAELRRALQRARMPLLHFVRDRCAGLRNDFRDAAATMPRGGAPGLAAMVRDRAGQFLAELDTELDAAVGAVAAELPVTESRAVSVPGPPDLTPPASASRRLEARLMAVLGAGFGVGVALASSRVVAGLAPGASVAALAVGVAVGVALTTWVVRTRGLLLDRALGERWSVEVTTTLRWHAEAVVTERLLGVQSDFSTRQGPRYQISVSESFL